VLPGCLDPGTEAMTCRASRLIVIEDLTAPLHVGDDAASGISITFESTLVDY
jgi:hypothetical protein